MKILGGGKLGGGKNDCLSHENTLVVGGGVKMIVYHMKILGGGKMIVYHMKILWRVEVKMIVYHMKILGGGKMIVYHMKILGGGKNDCLSHENTWWR